MNKKYTVECTSKIASDCPQTGKYFDSEEDAVTWVESECWIFSGEGWICIKCHGMHMGRLTLHRKKQGHGLDGLDADVKGDDGLDHELETGIDIVR